ncbi:Crotonobetainyl-CoA:carnitine CoA-transferase CaiB [Meinhardsimonia xiamenensis]|jgi:crotonobetainyl-CoA:carnitine CoA-transferase CaiB-like acyl-CoA transferase|uniref:Crotonobetainyl-CoA:carnitine CoA-transferase CaiB n=1 Tax=Meinhardsimonia xiamenensis TaxID=990712 RepID=A0A1G8XTE8_9RHOB|nr:CaiB/BaiF CoA-transferase family protein [Meinhardsimonia xiamenensis]PRX37036.1 crotonobetainyl-CoA:carnitine CoA-transferase CaiB-like acyl-CoA transferase [Meinhardsimonia xiamenensis]SDJ93798.1 Crotonobetainyl-CoA:carnitine CoA-transferase CaiB [Meinhardsimonia xiamenensis]
MLEGIRIIEIEGLGPAPFAAMMLAELGADVIVVHRRTPSDTPRAPGPNLLDRGKRSIALDLKDTDDAKALRALLATADGLIEGFRPGVMERLGFGPEAVHAIRPALVYGRMTGWGQTGPRAHQAGHDLNYIALSGALWGASPPGQPPFTPPTLLGDIGGGALYLVIGMLAGLIRARATGKGTVVDAAIVDGSAHMQALALSLLAPGTPLPPRGKGLLDGPYWSRTYACADGRFISVQCLEPRFHATFLKLLDLEKDPDFAAQFDPESWPHATARLETLFSSRPRDHWAKLFEGTDACVAPVLDPEESAEDPHMSARQTWSRAHGRLEPRAAPRFDNAPPPEPPAPPARGAHSAEILAELGLKPRS